MKPSWKGNREYLLAQLIRLVEHFIENDNIQIHPPMYNQDKLRRRIIITLNMSKVVQHLWEAVRFENALSLEPVFDTDRPITSTSDMLPWYTGRPCEHTRRSHINICVFDSTWEASEAFELDRNRNVAAWARTTTSDSRLQHSYKGVIRKFRPDYLVRLTNEKTLVLEVKGQDSQEQQTKREFLAEWIGAVNSHGGFSSWAADVSHHPGDIQEILNTHNRQILPGKVSRLADQAR